MVEDYLRIHIHCSQQVERHIEWHGLTEGQLQFLAMFGLIWRDNLKTSLFYFGFALCLMQCSAIYIFREQSAQETEKEAPSRRRICIPK